MAFDPKKEDFDRLFIHHLIETGATEPPNPQQFNSYVAHFSDNPDALIASDKDRAFHLMAQAVERIDYLLPTVNESEGKPLVLDGQKLLERACELDSHCFDALRMHQAMACTALEDHFQYLVEQEEEVHQICIEKGASAAKGVSEEFAEAVVELAMRPYYRWLAALATRALISGRNKAAISYGQKLFSLDPTDFGDIRFTLALAYAKLEDADGLAKLEKQYATVFPPRPPDDAWMMLARLALAFKTNNRECANDLLDKLLARYKTGALTLFMQRDLPEGEYARLNVEPYSEDELILAVSEAAVLLQEGNDFTGRGIFGRWLGSEIERRYPARIKDFQADFLHTIDDLRDITDFGEGLDFEDGFDFGDGLTFGKGGGDLS